MFLFDSNFVMDLEDEHTRDIVGPATKFLGTHRNQPHAVSIISVGEFAAGADDELAVRRFLGSFHWLALKEQIAFTAAEVDRELREDGHRLGENDNWIAGFGRYYSATVVTRDKAFERVRGLKVVRY